MNKGTSRREEHFDDIGFRELFGGIRVFFFLQNKICPFLGEGICIYVGPTPLFCLSALSGE
jgi:hypothetical protein